MVQFHPLCYDFYGGDVNTFLLETPHNVYLIDTAVASARDFLEDALRKALAGGKELHILNTHYHWDHASLGGYLKDAFQAKIWAHEKAPALFDAEQQFRTVYGDFLDTHPKAESIYSLYLQEFSSPALPDHILRDGDVIEEDGLHLRVLETPGHSEDSLSYFEENSRFLFAGDAVQGKGFDGNAPFYRDAGAYRSSILRLMELHPVKIFCGHGIVEGEAACEAFLRDSLDLWDRIDAAVRQAPEMSSVQLAGELAQALHYPNSVHIYTTVKAHRA